MNRIAGVLPLVLWLTCAGFAQQSNTAQESTAMDKQKEPKKRGFFKDVFVDGAKEGTSDAVKDHPIKIKVCEDNRSAEDIGREIGTKAVRVRGQSQSSDAITPAPCQTATNESPSAAATGRTVNDTELAGIFIRNPRREDIRTRFDVGWPRVALTLVQAPEWHLDKPSPGNRSLPAEGDACWTFKAKIWDSPTQSRDVQPFSQCNHVQVQGGDMTRVLSFSRWAGFGGPQIAPTKDTTGLYRNEGPVPPDSPFPNSVPYQKASFESSYSGWALRMIIDATDIDYSQRDRRLWVIVAPELEPAGASAFNKAVTPSSVQPSPENQQSQIPANGAAPAQTKGLNPDGSCGGVPAANVKTLMRYDTTYECVDGHMTTATMRKQLLELQERQKALTK